jgi:PmbA protein
MKTQSQIAERVLSLAKKQAEGAEVLFQESEESPVSFRANQLHSMESKFTTGVGLRLIKDGRIGFSCTTDLAKTKELVENALESAKYGQKAVFAFPKRPEMVEVLVSSPKVRAVKAETLIEAGNKTIGKLVKEVPEIQCEARFVKSKVKIRLLNSTGLDKRIERTQSAFEISGLVIGADGLLWVGEDKVSRDLVLPGPKTAPRLAERVQLAKKVVSLPGKPLPVLFAAEAMPNLWYALVVGVNGKTAQKGASPLVGKIGERLLDERVSITDDPTMDWGVASSPWDDEGVGSRKNVLYDKGTFKGFLYDLQTAGVAHAQSTGSARRSFSSVPFPSASNVVVKPGKDQLADLLKGMKEGVLIYNVIGGGQSNLLAGDFSLNIGLGYKIENGQIVGRVKDVMVAGNVYALLKNNLLALSRESEWAGNIKTPSVLFRDVSLASAKK